MAGQPRSRAKRAAAAVADRPNGDGQPFAPPRAVVYTVLQHAGRRGLQFEDAWALAVPLALAHKPEQEARDLALVFERERHDWRETYRRP